LLKKKVMIIALMIAVCALIIWLKSQVIENVTDGLTTIE